MNSYKIGNNTVTVGELISLWVGILISILLVILSIINICRYKTMVYYLIHIHNRKQHDGSLLIRCLLIICTILQLLLSIGYLTNNVICIQISWNIWIPIMLYCLAQLGIKVYITYMNLYQLQVKIYHKQIERLGFICWLLASCLNIMGSLLGFLYSCIDCLVLCWASWKIFTALSLTLILSLTFLTKNSIKNILTKKVNTPIIIKLKQSVFRLNVFIISLFGAIIFYLINASLELIWFYNLINKNNRHNNYDEINNPSVYSIMLIYIPQWTLTNWFILKYTWIFNISQYKHNLMDNSHGVGLIN